MANEQNLRPSEHVFTQEEAKKGGINSGKARRRRKAFAEAFNTLLERGFTDRNGNHLQGVEALAAKVFQQAMDGDIKAFVEVRNTVGEQPIQRVEVDTIDPQARAEMDELLGLGEQA